MKKIKDFEVSFDENGDLTHHCEEYRSLYSKGFSETNSIFPDTLEYIGYIAAKKGGNTHIEFQSLNSKRKYHMFISDFNDIILNKRFINNIVAGDFYFSRKGSSQGIKLILDIDP